MKKSVKVSLVVVGVFVIVLVTTLLIFRNSSVSDRAMCVETKTPIEVGTEYKPCDREFQDETKDIGELKLIPDIENRTYYVAEVGKVDERVIDLEKERFISTMRNTDKTEEVISKAQEIVQETYQITTRSSYGELVDNFFVVATSPQNIKELSRTDNIRDDDFWYVGKMCLSGEDGLVDCSEEGRNEYISKVGLDTSEYINLGE